MIRLRFTFLKWKRGAPHLRLSRNSYATDEALRASPQAERNVEVPPAERIRNFCIIAHVDHGKSTLADRLLEHTGTISATTSNKQVLDKLQVERERGITVKAQTSSMFWRRPGDGCHGDSYLLNLIDTPGHVDFNYEVSRSLAACQGALLVVDAAQGVQAQTVATFNAALEAGLTVIPTLNKIDLSTAEPDRVSRQIQSLFGYRDDEICRVSAKLGTGIAAVIEQLCESIPCPVAATTDAVQLFLFDSWYDQYKGIVCLVSVLGGVVRKGDRITSSHSGVTHDILELGILSPHAVPMSQLSAGQVGYVITGMRDVKQALNGDTFHAAGAPVSSGHTAVFKQPQPMVYAGVFPYSQKVYDPLRRAVEKLSLNDSAASLYKDSSEYLGQGWRIGFLGLLHMDVFKQRLAQEFGVDIIITTPNVPYRARLKIGEEELEIRSPVDFPDRSVVDCYLEPMVHGSIVSPAEFIGKVMQLCQQRRGEHDSVTYIDDSRVLIKYLLPLNEIIVDFFDDLKVITSGYASFDYEDAGYQESEVEKLEILLNGVPVEPLCTVVHKSKMVSVGRDYCARLQKLIPRQQFEIVVQAAVHGKAIARETIKPVRKDVTQKIKSGHDMQRKKKLLDAQKEGKKKLKRFGKVDVPHEVFLALLKK